MNRRQFLGTAAVAVLPVPGLSGFRVKGVTWTCSVANVCGPDVERAAEAIRKLADSLRAKKQWVYSNGQPFTGTVYETRPNDGRGFAAKHPDCVLARTHAMEPQRPGSWLRYPARWTLLREVT